MKKLVMTMVLLVLGTWVMGQADGGLEDVEAGMTLQMTAPILQGGARKFLLRVQTNDAYECTNYAVEHDARLEGNKLLIKVKGIRRTKPCADGVGPAVGNIDLSELKLGEYKVRITINRQIFAANLTVDSTYFKFDIPSEDPLLLRIYNGRLNLIPGGTIWGKCEYGDAKSKVKAQKFMSDLEKVGARKTMLPAGNYDEFYLHQPGVTEQKTVKGESFEYPFVYSFSGGLAPLQELMNGYRGDLKITLKNDKGETLRNW